ncbi:MAG: hypothetical protein WBD61_10710 [Desulfobulbales bacterium]|jgi:hypothetical protein
MMNPEFMAGENVSNQQSAFLKGAGKTGADYAFIWQHWNKPPCGAARRASLPVFIPLCGVLKKSAQNGCKRQTSMGNPSSNRVVSGPGYILGLRIQ